MPTPVIAEPTLISPDAAGVKLPIPNLNQVALESAYQEMRTELKTAAEKKSLASRDEIKTSLDDGTTLKIEEADKDDLLRILNEDQGDIVSASEKIEQCETTWEQTGKQCKTEDEAKKTGGLVSVENGFAGKFFRIDPLKSTDKNIVIIEDDVSPAIVKGIRGLRRQIAEGDTQAQKTYETLRDGNSVRVTYTSNENGAPQPTTITLKEFDEVLEKEAADLWTNAHGGEMSFADAKTKFPQITHAYRIKAERKIASDAEYTLHHSEEPKPDEANAAKTEAEKAKEGTEKVATLTYDFLEDIAEAAGQSITTTDSKGNVTLNEKALAELPPNEHVATLSLLVSTYHDILKDPNKQEQRDNLMTLAYLHLKNIKLDTITDPKIRDRFESLQKGNDLFDDKPQGRVAKLQASIYTHWLAPNQLGEIPLEQLTRDMILAIKLEAIKGVKEIRDARGQFERFEVGDDVQALLTSWDVKDDERQKIFRLATGDHSANRLMSQEFSISAQTLIEPKSGEVVAQKVLTALTESAENRGKPDFYKSKEKQNTFLKFFHHNLSGDSLKEFAKKHGFPPQMGMGVLILALFLPMIQGVMDTGNETDEGRKG